RVAGYLAIVRNVHVGHDPVVVAHAGYTHVLRRARIDGDVLAHHVAVADLESGGLALVLLILRHAADRAKAVKDVVAADGGLPVYDAMRPHLAACPDAHARPHDTVGAHRDIVGQLGLGRHNGGGMDAPGHQSSRARMAHMSLAAATSWPSTVAHALYLHMVRLRRSAETSSRSWSPGTTGLRKRAPSTPTR